MTQEVVNPKSSPRFFRDILGQERVLQYLKAARQGSRLAHAYLFLGPEGVGKESVARVLAAALNCEAPWEDGDACGVCPSCKRMAAGMHPDFHLISPASEGRTPQIKIEQIREFRRLTAYAPVAGGWRVALIKPAEALNDAAANALLKTLEEPPLQHLLILTAGVEADLFPTVVSRCQKLAFIPLPYHLIQAELARRGVSPTEAAVLAALSGGSLGRALAVDPGEFLRQRREVFTALEGLWGGNATAALDWAQGLAKAPAATDMVLWLTQLWYRDLLVLACGAPERLLAHQDRLAELKAEAARKETNLWLAKLAALSAAQRHLRANLNPELTLDLLGFRLQA